MKKLLSALLLAAIVISAVSCTGGDTADTTAADTKSEITTAATTETPVSGDDTTEASGDTVESTATALEVLNASVTKIANITGGTVYAEPEADGALKMDAITFSTFFGYTFKFGDDGLPAYPDAYASIDNYALRKPNASTDVLEVDVIKFKSGTDEAVIKELCEGRITKIKNDFANNAHYDTTGEKKKHVDALAYKVIGSYAVIACAENSTEVFAAAEVAINAKTVIS